MSRQDKGQHCQDLTDFTMRTKGRRAFETWGPLALLGAVALLLRILDFLPRRSFWLDEAMLGINIQQSGFRALLGRLDFDQAAPVGFLWAERLVYVTLGSNDFWLRVFPFLFGLLSIWMVYCLARQNGSRHFAWLALALVALSPAHLRYSGDLKQYTLDVLVAAALLWSFGQTLRSPQYPGAHGRLALAGAMAIWFSHPSMFVLAGIGIAGVVSQWRRFAEVGFWKTWLSIGTTWLISFVVLYAVNLRHVSGSEDLTTYWAAHFAPALSRASWHWYLNHFIRNSEYLFSTGWTWASFVLSAIGLVSLLVRRTAIGLAILLMVGVTLLASTMSLYPFYGRLLMFMLPAGALLVAESVEVMRLFLKRHSRLAAQLFYGVAVVALLQSPLRLDIDRVSNRSPETGMKPLIPAMLAKSLPGDQIFVYYGAVPEFRFYAPAFNIANDAYISGSRHRTDPPAYRAELDQSLKSGRVWFVFSHGCCARFNEHAYFSEYFAARGALLDEVSAPGATAYLYRIDRPFLAGDVRKD